MLFKNNSFAFKFYLMGLNAGEQEEVTKLITENGGEICNTRTPPVITFSGSDDVCGTGEPVFHINYVRECVRQQKVLHLIHFIIGPSGFFGCLQCIFTSAKNDCQLHSFSTIEACPNLTSTQIKSTSDTDATNDGRRTGVEHNYAHGDCLTAQTANVPVQKQPCNTKHVARALPRSSKQWPTGSDFSLLESSQDIDILPDQSPQEADFRPDKSPPVVQCLPNNSVVSVFSTASNGNKKVKSSNGFVSIRPSIGAKPKKTTKDTVLIDADVPDTVSFEELSYDQESEENTKERRETEDRVVASSSKMKAKPAKVTGGKTVGSSKIGNSRRSLDRFDPTSSEMDDTDDESSMTSKNTKQWIFRRKRSTPPSKKDLDKNKESNDDTQQPGPSKLIDLTADDDTIEASEKKRPGRSRKSVIYSDSDSSVENLTPSKRKPDRIKTEESVNRRKKHPTPIRNILCWEQRQMVKYLIVNSAISEAKGLRIWNQMIKDGFLVHRTAQSLNNNFRRMILPSIDRFQMTRKSLRKFKKLQK